MFHFPFCCLALSDFLYCHHYSSKLPYDSTRELKIFKVCRLLSVVLFHSKVKNRRSESSKSSTLIPFCPPTNGTCVRSRSGCEECYLTILTLFKNTASVLRCRIFCACLSVKYFTQSTLIYL